MNMKSVHSLRALFTIILLLCSPWTLIKAFDKKNPQKPCLECHSSKISNFAPIIWDEKYMHQPVRMSQCTICHKENDRASIKEATNCFACHDVQRFKGKAYRHPGSEENYCLSCHQPHSSNHEFLLKDEPVAFCQSCHTEMKTHRSHPVEGNLRDPIKHRAMTCTSTCHTVHLSDYPELIPCGNRELCLKCHSDIFR